MPLFKKRLPFLFVFLFFFILVFTVFRNLFFYYFEADEWFHFTRYLPLTGKPDGLLAAFISTFMNSGALSAGQHVTPIASTIFFLNTKFFGLNYFFYAFVSLLLHSINSFLVFLFIKTMLSNVKNIVKNTYAIMGGIFFAIAPTPLHTVTGAAPFYGENVLSLTFALLCMLFFKFAYIKKEKKYLYLSILFLFFALFSKEYAAYLFLILPVMAFIEKRIFSFRFLAKLYIFCIIAYAVFRFVIPNVYLGIGPLIDKLVNSYIYSSGQTQPAKTPDTGTIVSGDLSIHKNLPGEIVFRTITFPLKMVGSVFVPRQTLFSIVGVITPIVYPVPSVDDKSGQVGFLYGPGGNNMVLYLISLGILSFCINLILNLFKHRRLSEAQTLITGLAIIIISALPLVAIIFIFPRWGYDYYFDSRYYYHPTAGAAIVFPFLLFGFSKVISSILKTRKASFIAAVLFITWLVFDLTAFNYNFNIVVNRYGSDRREVVNQLKNYIPSLSRKTVFYIETDGLSPFGPVLPFYNSVPQDLTVIYYDKNHLPDSFFDKTIFDGMPQGYLYSEGRGFGYYTSKKDLSEALVLRKFELSDVRAFYYKSLKGELLNKTLQVRKEMQGYLKETDIQTWKKFDDPLSKIRFLYPLDTEIKESKSSDANVIKILTPQKPGFNIELFAITVTPAFNIHDNIQFLTKRNGNPLALSVIEKDVFFDKYKSNKVIITDEDQRKYFMRIDNMLIYVKTENATLEGIKLIERILGSLEIINEK
ncbi:MAG: glycosyltransferase family 39 protein [Patescibacteria group bacterium]|nr:glycosyltransferase family 39 protein [Patescibacteria group bacterium]